MDTTLDEIWVSHSPKDSDGNPLPRDAITETQAFNAWADDDGSEGGA